MNKSKTNIIRRKELNLFYFTLIDIMFFPYVFHLPIKLSMLTLTYWLFKKKNGANKRVLINLMTFLYIGVMCVCIGILKWKVSSSVILTNIQTMVIILYGYLIYEYVMEISLRYKVDVTNILLLYLAVTFVFMVMYWITPNTFFNIRPFWTIQRGGESFISYANNRFTSIVSEPNNLAALVVAIMTFLLTSDKMYRYEKIVVTVISACIIITTSSNSGMIYFTVVLLLSLVFSKRKKKKTEAIKINPFRSLFMFFISVACIGFVVFVIVKWDSILQYSLMQNATSRYKLYINDTNTDYSGKRLEVWKTYLSDHNIFEHVLIGDASAGYTHSGHLYIIYAFGFIAYIWFMRLFIFNENGWKEKSEILVKLVFLGVFSMNTLIVDLRAFTMFVVILARAHTLASGNKETN
jgi:hypothetical protein